ncbi:hypothetical protein J6590_020881 [Homalodisca vitripennis]|nr:hypothetical protein J6590_020881 [Homalodisca vitripennis]
MKQSHTNRRKQKSDINRQPVQIHVPHLRCVTVKGNSHIRHIAGLVRERTSSTLSVGGMCKPRVRLLDIVNTRPTSPESNRNFEVLIASTIDLEVGKQQNIYRHTSHPGQRAPNL